MAVVLPCVGLYLSLFLCCRGAVSVVPYNDLFQNPITAPRLTCSTPSPSRRLLAALTPLDTESKISQCPQQNSEVSWLGHVFILLGVDCLTDNKEVTKGVEEFNIPIIRPNRKFVASIDGGLQNPSCLVFYPNWGSEQLDDINKKNVQPVPSGIQRPGSDEDIAFTSIPEPEELIRTRQITQFTRLP